MVVASPPLARLRSIRLKIPHNTRVAATEITIGSQIWSADVSAIL